MPSANTVARLPRLIDDFVRSTSLYVPCECLALLLVENLAENHGTWVLVVEMGGDAQSAVTHRIEGQHGDIEIDKVGLIAVDGIEGAVIEVGDELLCRRAGTMAPVPLVVDAAVVP